MSDDKDDDEIFLLDLENLPRQDDVETLGGYWGWIDDLKKFTELEETIKNGCDCGGMVTYGKRARRGEDGWQLYHAHWCKMK